MYQLSKIIFVLILLLSFNTHAATAHVIGKIDKVAFSSENYSQYNTTDKGIAFIYMSNLPQACGVQSAHFGRVAIDTNHPLYQSIVSAALTAKASSQDVQLMYVDQCTVRNNAWDFALLVLL